MDLTTNTVDVFDPVINSENNEGTIAFNGDFTEAVFTRCQGEKNATEVTLDLLTAKNSCYISFSPLKNREKSYSKLKKTIFPTSPRQWPIFWWHFKMKCHAH